MTSGVFLCLVNFLHELVDAGYDLKLGRGWFNYCTTSVPGAQILLLGEMCLVFSSSSSSAVCARKISEFLIL